MIGIECISEQVVTYFELISSNDSFMFWLLFECSPSLLLFIPKPKESYRS